jgi:ABC-type polysaccharide/polyol phosphate export permease
MCPPEIFPAVTVVSHTIHHLLALPVLVVATVVAAIAGWHPFPWTLVLLPLALVPWVLLTGGAALMVSALSVGLRDVRDLIGHVLNLLFFASPIIYGLEGLEVPSWLAAALRLNPLASLVTVYRDLAFTGRIASWESWAVAVGTALVMWFLGAWVFSRHRDSIVEAV